MAWLIPYVIAFLAAVGILSERRRALLPTRVRYAAVVLVTPPALMLGVGAFLGSSPGEGAFVVVVLLAFVVAPLALAWHFLRRHPHPGTPDPGLKSFRLSVGAWPRHITILGILAFVVAGVMGTLNPLTQLVYDRIGADHLEQEVVRAEVAGQHFDIPMGYFFMEGYAKRGYWPRAKQGRVEVEALAFSALLPDLRPYHPDEKHLWNIDGGGRGDRIDVTIWAEDFTENNVRAMRRGLDDRDQRLPAEAAKPYGIELDNQGLDVFRGAGVRFLPRDESEASVIYCADPENVPSPSCRAKSAFSHGIALEYRFSLKYLPEWRRIDHDVKKLVDQLRAPGDVDDASD
ncbi:MULTISPECIES: hypothetical protein [unclassified Thioalkalivibrio]|uniref:hypothetical protein n=1 Tax=unclassified Thioalkalivibrio TaxID=2621013 RepID=UPI000374B4D8|nr:MULTISPECIES: hypothetical protein [unclassified Thioalkalivibrio]